MKTYRFLNQTGFLLSLFLLASSASAALTAKQIQSFNSDTSSSATTVKPSANPYVVSPVIGGSSSGSCEEEACKLISCNFQSDTDAVKKACASSSGGSCVSEVCSRDGCSTQSELLRVIESCKSKPKSDPAGASGGAGSGSGSGSHKSYFPVAHASGDCVSAVCSHIGCAFASETESIARACQHASGSCVRSICDQTGCTFKSDALSAIKSCDSSHQLD